MSRPSEGHQPKKSDGGRASSQRSDAHSTRDADPLLTVEETLEKVDDRVRSLRTKLHALEQLRATLLQGQPSDRFDQEDLNWVALEIEPVKSEIECWEAFGGNLRAERVGLEQKLTPIEQSLRDRYDQLQRLQAETRVFEMFPQLRAKFLEKQKSLLTLVYRQKAGGRFRWKELESAVSQRVALLTTKSASPESPSAPPTTTPSTLSTGGRGRE